MSKKQKTYVWMCFVGTLFLCLLLWGFLGVWVLYGSAANVMSQVGLQRARVERLTKDALIIAGTSGGPSDFTQAVSEAQNILPNWQATQKGLQVGDPALGLPAHPPANILLLVTQAQSDYTSINTALQHILANPTDQSDKAKIQLQIVLDHENNYYIVMSQVNIFWQQRIDEVFWHLFIIETVLVMLVALLVILSFIGFLRWIHTQQTVPAAPLPEQPAHIRAEPTPIVLLEKREPPGAP